METQTVEQAVTRAEGAASSLMNTLGQVVRPGEHDVLIDAPMMVSAMAARTVGLDEDRFAEVAREVYREVIRRSET